MAFLCCPDHADGVHDLTKGPVCSCGYKNEATRYAVSIDIYDNETKTHLVNEAFNTSGLSTIEDELQKALRVIERI